MPGYIKALIHSSIDSASHIGGSLDETSLYHYNRATKRGGIPRALFTNLISTSLNDWFQQVVDAVLYGVKESSKAYESKLYLSYI